MHAAPVLLAMCYKHQCKKHIASDTMCYGINNMSIGQSGIVLRMHCPKISTGQEKLAPTGRHGRHVFATLTSGKENIPKLSQEILNTALMSSYYFWNKISGESLGRDKMGQNKRAKCGKK